MRIGLVTGSIARIGSGRAVAVPLARALSRYGAEVHGLETTRFKRRRETVEGLDVHFEPIAPYLASYYVPTAHSWLHSSSRGVLPHPLNDQRKLDMAEGDALLALADRLDLDAIYAFHNTNVARLLRAWPDRSRLLIINLIGFGIDPSRGGAMDTFPIQSMIFGHPHWDLHIASTHFEYRQYEKVYEQLGIDPDKLLLLPHSYDDENFRPPRKPASHRHSHHNKAHHVKVLYPVNVYPRKNIELAIDVIAILKQKIDCELVITGSIWDQDYHARLTRHAQDQGVGDRVQFLGGVPIESLIELYHQADVTVYTSHQETFGYGIIESLGCGTPVVGPAWIIPCHEILSDTPGCYAVQRNAVAFAEAIRRALDGTNDSEHLASYAKENYGSAVIARQFLERCQEIKAAKDRYGTTLATINWKDLYLDAGDLLL